MNIVYLSTLSKHDLTKQNVVMLILIYYYFNASFCYKKKCVFQTELSILSPISLKQFCDIILIYFACSDISTALSPVTMSSWQLFTKVAKIVLLFASSPYSASFGTLHKYSYSCLPKPACYFQEMQVRLFGDNHCLVVFAHFQIKRHILPLSLLYKTRKQKLHL